MEAQLLACNLFERKVVSFVENEKNNKFKLKIHLKNLKDE
jgi:hypothetical protein